MSCARTFATCVLLFASTLPPVQAEEPTCAVTVSKEPTGQIDDFRDGPGGVLLIAADGLFRYNGSDVLPVEGDPIGLPSAYYTGHGELLLAANNSLYRFNGERIVRVWQDPESDIISNDIHLKETSKGLLITGNRGLYLYDGSQVTRVEGERTDNISDIRATPNGLLLATNEGLFTYNGSHIDAVEGNLPIPMYVIHKIQGEFLIEGRDDELFQYDGSRLIRIEGDLIGHINAYHATSSGVLLAAHNGLFRYDGSHLLRVEGIPADNFNGFQEVSGDLLLYADNGLFRYRNSRAVPVEGDQTDRVYLYHNTADGLLLAADRGLFRYDGSRVVRVEGEATGYVSRFLDTSRGILLVTGHGLFRYDKVRVIRVLGDPTSDINDFRDTSDGVLLAAMKGLFRYDGMRSFHVPSEPTGPVYGFHNANGELLLATGNGLFRAVRQPLSAARIVLNNSSALSGAAPSELGIPTHWTMTHGCSPVADRLGLIVAATNERGEPAPLEPAVGFRPSGKTTSFEATVPIPAAGKWIFQILSSTSQGKQKVGDPSEAITFAIPVSSGFTTWIAAWWRVIAVGLVGLLAIFNLAIVAAARYTAAAWRLATDESWRKAALLPQRLLLRHWRGAQLWLLDLYVQQRRKVLPEKASPFLSLPLRGPAGCITDSNAVLAHLGSSRHVWVQGSAGMGKTAIFLHLRQSHFGASEKNAYTIFRRDRYVLVPIEARRFPEAAFEEKSASGWVVSCVLSVLSEGGLTFEDRSLVHAMLSKGTLALAIDGLNEVGRGPAVAAFAAEFPAAPLFVTSQEPGEAPFAVWRLPRTISEHVNGLLGIYLGQNRGEVLAKYLRSTGLFEHLRSGYDVRLVIDLAEASPEGADLPRDRIGLYRAAVAAGWPDGDTRLELLEAAAWKLISERGPNEDKRRLKPDSDAPKDLLEQLEAARERSGRSIRLIRAAPPGYEFVHDQMNAYLAACWLTDRPTTSVICDLLTETNAWRDSLETQRTLWGFVAALLDRSRLETLWIFAGDDDRRAVLGRALAERAEREYWVLTRRPISAAVTIC